jgi:hypothetical protein
MNRDDLARGLTAWPLAALLTLVAIPGDWDMGVLSILGVLVGTAAAFTALGAVVWLPLADSVLRRTRDRIWVQISTVGALGAVLGGTSMLTLTLASGNATWPPSLTPIFVYALASAAASLAGFGIAWTRASRRLPLRRRRTFTPA